MYSNYIVLSTKQHQKQTSSNVIKVYKVYRKCSLTLIAKRNQNYFLNDSDNSSWKVDMSHHLITKGGWIIQ